MKKTKLLFTLLLHLSINGFCSSNLEENAIINVEELLQASPPYQDILINGEIAQKGTQLCAPRLELVRPILDQYSRRFSLLDIGAMEGYFTFRIAKEYDAICTMIEGGKSKSLSKLYWYAQDKLYSLCHLNNHLKNRLFRTLAHLKFPSRIEPSRAF